ncbi:glycosyltransferase [Kocuria sediminis]|uniref:D-inositol 3-phosphate glycosyltransferase n=1 Tax=Kocuria sediminis TaxID=1038857 RepID=A0A6N8GPD6_9MICC|nr:glycosyltransferase [Kocuria sediminis]MUN64032.1 glycosyltransferase [Kocuria sediminis]
MRVLVVSTWYPSAERPGETPFVPRHVRAISRHHDVRVVHVRLLRTGPARGEVWDGVPVLRVPFHPLRPRTLLQAYRVLSRGVRGAELVHSMAFSTALVLAPLAVARLLGRPWVHTEHWNGVHTPEQVGGVWRWFAWSRRVLRLPELVTGVSEAMCGTLRRFCRPGSVRWWGNVVDHDDAVVPPPRGRTLELVSVGGLWGLKDPLLAVEAVAALRRSGADVHLVWCGEGPLRGQVEERIEALGLQGAVELAGSLEPAQVRRRLAAADVFLLPSRTETFCVAAAEALAAGRPVVMGAVGAHTEFLHAGNSRLVAERTPEAFGRAVLDVVAADDLLTPEAMAEEIRAVYGSERIAADIDRLYRSVAPGPGAEGRL